MNSKTKYRIIAILICIVIYALYISLSVSMGWEGGGGVLVLVILFGILRAVWKGVTNLADEEDKTNETPTEPQEETLPEIPVDAEEEPLPAEEVIPIPIEETDESLPQDESEELPPIPEEEESNIIVTPTEKLEAIDQHPKTHWQKFRLFYIIGIVLCVIIAVVLPVSIHVQKQNKIEILLSEAIKACENTFFDLALQHLDKAYALDSKNYAVNYYIGCVHCHKHNYEPARKYLETAYKINKKKEDYVLSFDTIGFDRLLYYYYISLKDYQLSDNQTEINQRTLIAQEYLTQCPNECDAYRCMAYEYGFKNDYDKVKNFFDKILRINPISGQLTDYMSDIYSKLTSRKYGIGSKEECVGSLFCEADREWILEKFIKEYPDLEYVWKFYYNEVTDQLFPLDWQDKTRSSQQENNKTTTKNKSVEKTKAKPSNVHNGHKFVDLGLSVKWATANIGANKPEEYGDYFAWGEVINKSEYQFDWNTYKWSNGDENDLTKYNTKVEKGIVDNKIVLERKDDAAFARWGGSWRMPTEAEWQELIDYCTWIWTTINGIEGYKIKSTISGYNSNYIFLPTHGEFHLVENISLTEGWGSYWSSSLMIKFPDDAKILLFNETRQEISFNFRCNPAAIRPVCP